MLAADFLLLISDPKNRAAHRNGDIGIVRLDVDFFHPAS